MEIIIKFIVRSIKENKFRTFLIIFAVALSGALYFASTSLSDSLVEIYTNKMRQATGNADIMIFPKRGSPAGVISEAPALRLKDKTHYIIKAISGTGRYKIANKNYERISLTGMTLNDYKKINDLELAEELGGASFESNSIIISKMTAEKYHLNIGDQMEIYIGDVRRNIKVYGIALPTGMFLDESQESKALISYRSLCDYMQTKGKPTTIYIKAADGVSVDSLIGELQKGYPKYGVEEPFSKEQIYDNTSMLSMPLLLMTLIVTFMSIFIIYSSFKVITLEKLPIIGTFRSIGASRKMMDKVLLMESLFYGVAGGLAACAIGIGILYIMTQYTTPDSIKEYIEIKINISFIKLAITFILSVIVCLISSMAPIIKVSKIPLKEIVLGNIVSKKKRKIRKDVLGILCIIAAFILPIISSRSLSAVLSGLSVILTLVGIINILPIIIKSTSKISEKLFYKVFGNIGILAVKNIKGNKSILNSIALITIGVVTLLMINNISINVSVEVINFYKKTCISDMEVWMNNMDKSSVRGLLRHEGVESVYPLYGTYGIEVKELGEKLGCIESIQDESYTKYIQFDYMGKQKELLSEINNDRYLIMTVIMKNRYDLKEGDKLTLKFPSGDRVYTILGFVNTFMWNGSFALAPDTYLKNDTEAKYYNSAYVKVKGDPKMVLESLKKQYSDRYLGGMTIEEMLNANKESNDQLMSMLIGFSVLALIIGSIGVINNLIISFIERKQSLAVLRSIGMSKKQVIQMLFIESLYSGSIGGLVGIGGGIIVMKIVPYILEAMQVPVPTYLVPGVLWIYLVGGMAITVLASISPAKRSSKLNIIEAIKYE
ncbi:MAG: hypothetical protein K0S71_2351 [Clostridia bacterium]|jgi:putative ABC transport system permease protein|nr:hypothetical protein [Clostridia bacterium]